MSGTARHGWARNGVARRGRAWQTILFNLEGSMSKELAKTKNKEVVTLGDQEVFARRDGKGMIRPLWKTVKVKKGRDTYQVGGKTNLTNAGYHNCNRVANLSTMKPNTLFIDGAERNNPYIERDPISQEAVNAYARGLAIGFAPTGNPEIVDKVVILNLRQYLLTDLKKKVTDYPEAGCFGLGKVGGSAPDSWLIGKTTKTAKPKNNAVMRFLPAFLVAGDEYMGYWLDMAHPEIQATYKAQETRQKFPDRLAQTMAERNAKAAHSCMPTKDISAFVDPKSGDAEVMVYGYIHDASGDDLRALAQAAADGDLTGVKRMGGAETKLIDAGTDRIEYEDAVVQEGVLADEDKEPDKKKEPTKEEQKKKTGKKKDKPVQEKKPEPEPEKEPDSPPAEKEKMSEVGSGNNVTGWTGKDGEKEKEPEEPEIGPAMQFLNKIAEEDRPSNVTRAAQSMGYQVESYRDLPEEHAEKVAKAIEKYIKSLGDATDPSVVTNAIIEEEEESPAEEDVPIFNPETGEVEETEPATPDPSSKAHDMIHQAERIIGNPDSINKTAGEMFPGCKNWRGLVETDKEKLLAELKKGFSGG